ncbi:MAG: hypothetical protein H0T42_02095 [Deltaproteobacteria bacterium]|nr:hypothetical protein [Deltaproteobacteria bacterium]
MIRLAAILAIAAGCTSFPDEDIVLDLRVLAMSATPPEQVVTIDLSARPDPAELLAQLAPTEVCALITDPVLDRRIRYRFTLCVYGDSARCDPELPMTPLAAGIVEDPDTAPRSQTQICASVAPNGNLLGILTETLESDRFAGLGGVDYLVSLTVGGEDEDPALDEHAAKTLRVAPRIPVSREPNINPTLDGIDATLGDAEPVRLAIGRCADQPQPLEIPANARLELMPIESATARETYVVPTLDGRSMMFTESLTYQWLATAGGFSQGSTGGTRDSFGNIPELFTEYRAPNANDLDGPTDIQLWIVQRDERYGATWYESCVRVVP